MKIWVGVIAAVLLTATSAAAQRAENFATDRHFYAGMSFGFHWPHKVDSTSVLPAPDGEPYHWEWRTQANFAVMGRIGYRFSPHFRLECESAYYHSRLLSVHAPGQSDANGMSVSRPGEPYGLCAEQSVLPNCIPVSGQRLNWTHMWTGFLNAIYDMAPRSRFNPFIGAGVGMAHIEWAAYTQKYLFSGVGTVTANNPAVQQFWSAGTLFRPNQFAIQFLGGFSYPLTHHVTLDLTYYYYFTPFKLTWNPVNSTPGLPVGAGLRPDDFNGRFHDDSIMVGFRYAF